MKLLSKETIRYVLAGFFNTALTYLIYLFFLMFMTYSLSYTLAYILGILTSYLINTVFVFRVNLSWRKLLQYPFIYLVQFFINSFVLSTVVTLFGVDEKIGPIFVLFVSVPISYLLTKLLLNRKTRKDR